MASVRTCPAGTFALTVAPRLQAAKTTSKVGPVLTSLFVSSPDDRKQLTSELPGQYLFVTAVRVDSEGNCWLEHTGTSPGYCRTSVVDFLADYHWGILGDDNASISLVKNLSLPERVFVRYISMPDETWIVYIERVEVSQPANKKARTA